MTSVCGTYGSWLVWKELVITVGFDGGSLALAVGGDGRMRDKHDQTNHRDTIRERWSKLQVAPVVVRRDLERSRASPSVDLESPCSVSFFGGA